MSKQWNRKKARELLVILCGLAAYCIIATVADLSCIIKTFTGISCPGCGMTRACMALFRLDFAAAWFYHPLVFYLIIAIPFMIVLHLKDKDRLCKRILFFSAVLMLAVYLYRMIVAQSPVLVIEPEKGILGRLFLRIAELFS